MRTVLLTAVFVTFAVPVLAQDFNKGVEAYRTGDYVTAMNEWRPLAEQGKMVAQYALGVMYNKGLGVLQDQILAHMWYNLGAANGNDFGGRNRDIIAQKMSSEDISKAQALAAKCIKSDYEDCGA